MDEPGGAFDYYRFLCPGGSPNIAGRSVKEAEIEATVIRCGCGDPGSHKGPCPRGRVEPLGVIARAAVPRWRVLARRIASFLRRG